MQDLHPLLTPRYFPGSTLTSGHCTGALLGSARLRALDGRNHLLLLLSHSNKGPDSWCRLKAQLRANGRPLLSPHWVRTRSIVGPTDSEAAKALPVMFCKGGQPRRGEGLGASRAVCQVTRQAPGCVHAGGSPPKVHIKVAWAPGSGNGRETDLLQEAQNLVIKSNGPCSRSERGPLGSGSISTGGTSTGACPLDSTTHSTRSTL